MSGTKVRVALALVVVAAALSGLVLVLSTAGDHHRRGHVRAPVYRMPDGHTIPRLPPGAGMVGG